MFMPIKIINVLLTDRENMKKYVVIILMLFSCMGSIYSQNPSSAIAFDERVHDFGTILEKNGKVTHTFTFRNNAKTAVIINDIYSACGCVGNIISKDPVKPGAKGKVTITFNPDYKSGFFSKEIVVYSNNGQEYNRIWVQGVVTAAEHPVEEDYPYNFGKGLYLRLKVMAFGYVKPGETKQMQLHYANATNREMEMKFVIDGNKSGLVFTSPGKIGPKQRGVINFSYTMPATATDDVMIRVYPYVNGTRLDETLDVRVLNENKLKKTGR
ncbi:MAG: DUF1573 domain-containing protein [Bacteroidetes bacterium]|jgi:hypothetical protein|nr:MAG: DUF1573 domain-containing protein [Bacteroidota bacterium]